MENQNLSYLHVPELRRHEITAPAAAATALKGVDIDRPHANKAYVRYKPEVSDLQRRLRTRHALQFVVEYDVQRNGRHEKSGGEIQVCGEAFFETFSVPYSSHVF